MSEEEIINNINQRLDELKTSNGNYTEGIFKVEDILDLLNLYNQEKENTNKLIRYIAISEGKDFKDVIKEFKIK